MVRYSQRAPLQITETLVSGSTEMDIFPDEKPVAVAVTYAVPVPMPQIPGKLEGVVAPAAIVTCGVGNKTLELLVLNATTTPPAGAGDERVKLKYTTEPTSTVEGFDRIMLGVVVAASGELAQHCVEKLANAVIKITVSGLIFINH